MGMTGNFKQVSEEMLKKAVMKKVEVTKIIFGDDDAGLDIDKSWHGIHYLLNETVWEGEGVLSEAIIGGKELDEECGYGPVRYLLKGEVKLIAEALSEVNEEEMIKRFQPKKMESLDIYPSVWEGKEDLDYLLGNYREMVKYYQEAAEKGNAMLLYLI